MRESFLFLSAIIIYCISICQSVGNYGTLPVTFYLPVLCVYVSVKCDCDS